MLNNWQILTKRKRQNTIKETNREKLIYLIAHISDDGQNREETVAEHTQKTMFLCKEKGKRCGLSGLMSVCGIFHDMGKNKQKFGDYLHADEKRRRTLRGTIAHASTGARYIYDAYHDSPGKEKVMAEMISYAIAAHHGLFDCTDKEHADVFSARLQNVDDYEEACQNAKRDYLGEYKLDEIFQQAAGEFRCVWSKIGESYTRIKVLLAAGHKADVMGMLFDCKFFLLACLQRLLLSILIDSDWEATSDFMAHVDTLSKPSEYDTQQIFIKVQESFHTYMDKKRKSVNRSGLTEKERTIFEARNSLQEACVRFAQNPAGIYCLPIPTGGGKTLSALAYALEYARLHPQTERIIYVSPFISITEQNAQVFRDAIGNDKWILEHHSSVVRNERNGSDDDRVDKCIRYDMNWEEPFICTTFVQFMNTLFSDKGESIRRMHRLVNSVVIIDEVQSMPLRCVHTFNYMINFLNAVCNTNIVLCTATQPDLEAAECPICYSEPKYMIEGITGWFETFDRVKICTPSQGESYTFEKLGREIANQIEEYRSILVVLNTKAAVRALYDILRALNINTQYLTTNLCAEHRSDKIKAIKAILEKKEEPIVVVSTNLIEAGVDLSFECVYRSMTGLDSVAQTAGRCNRNGELEYGTVYLIKLDGEDTGNMQELQEKKRVTKYVIDRYRDRGGRESLLMPGWMDLYYKCVYEEAADKMNFPIKELDTNMIELLSRGFGTAGKIHTMNQAYKTAGQAYRVIDDSSFGVIVPYEKGAEIIASIQDASDPADIRAYIRQAQRYTVNVRGNQLKKLEGLITPISEYVPDVFMVAAPGAYHSDYGITPEWETLIF